MNNRICIGDTVRIVRCNDREELSRKELVDLIGRVGTVASVTKNKLRTSIVVKFEHEAIIGEYLVKSWTCSEDELRKDIIYV
jgi:hypothetical protein